MNDASAEAHSFTARIAMWSARHRKAVAIAWVLIVIAALAACSAVPANTDIELKAPGEAGEAFDLLQERFGEDEDIPTEFIVFSHPSLTVDDQAYADTVRGLRDALTGLVVEEKAAKGSTTVVSDTRVVASITTHYDIGAPREQSPFVATNAEGGDVTFAILELEGDIDTAVDNVGLVLDAVAEAQGEAEGFEILVGGSASLQKQITEIVEEDFGRALFLNLPITFFILILAFGALVVASVPLALAFAAIITANGLLAIISQWFALSEIYIEMVLLLGLATGIDYALFVVTRFRRERAAGASEDDALRIATSTSGKAVAFAGVTVLLSLSGLFLVDDLIFSSLALASIVVVVMAVIISMTLLPALLALLGDNVNRLRVPFIGGGTGEGGGIWGVITDQVLARPAIWATTALVALLALASPIIFPGFNLGFNGVKSVSDDAEGKKALIALEENFTLGLAQPALVLVDAGEKGNVFDANIQSHVDQLISLVEAESVLEDPDAFYGEIAQEPEFNDAGDTEILFIPINADFGEDKAFDAVNRLRDELIPAAFGDSPARVLSTGATAGSIDFKDNILAKTPLVFAFVLGLAFIILLVMFRSIVIPIKAIILNLLSVGAAYGVLVLVFQEGWLLEGILDFEATGIVEAWLPLFLFAILFGLSMDYHMFVLARIKEAYERGASNDEAVSIGIKATAGTITMAAAIMVAVFSIFAFTRDIGLKQFGVGLGVAILIDATVIRSILLPASMKLLGDWNWYLPSWLQWIPEIKMAE
ncbi:MAG: MMPL family transporter [Chloroflexi bacterium]|nr:MMPL family transporter [Chloroflexota bacterium]MCH8064527.1 MMPL family transporter [Chloroflexota bacterium]